VGARQPGGRGRRRGAAGGAGAHRAPGRLRGARAGRAVRLGAWFVHLRATLPVQAGQVGRAMFAGCAAEGQSACMQSVRGQSHLALDEASHNGQCMHIQQ